MMTPNEQRIAIAEWMGWKLVQPNSEWGTSSSYPQHVIIIPNYPEDLNAMHETEKKLSGEQRRQYLRELYHVAVEREASKAGISTDVLCNEDEMFIVTSSTPQQRSEALCRTLWPERFE